MTADDLKEALEAIGWPQAELARRLDKREATVSDWVNGKVPVPAYVNPVIELALSLRNLRDGAEHVLGSTKRGDA